MIPASEMSQGTIQLWFPGRWNEKCALCPRQQLHSELALMGSSSCLSFSRQQWEPAADRAALTSLQITQAWQFWGKRQWTWSDHCRARGSLLCFALCQEGRTKPCKGAAGTSRMCQWQRVGGYKGHRLKSHWRLEEPEGKGEQGWLLA